MTPSTAPTVGEFMTLDPCAIDEDLTLADAADRMLTNNIRHLLVLREGHLIGLLDASDLALANAVTGDRTDEINVSSATRGVFRCPPHMPVAHVVATMERNHYGCAAVVDDRNNVVGIFTITDALRALRRTVAGHPVQAQVEPTHRPDIPEVRDSVLPRVRVKRMLKARGAAPSADQGLVLGTVGV